VTDQTPLYVMTD